METLCFLALFFFGGALSFLIGCWVITYNKGLNIASLLEVILSGVFFTIIWCGGFVVWVTS